MSDQQKSERKNVFIGPSDESWIKFKCAGLVWKLTRENPIPMFGYIPGVKRLAKWAFKVRVMSRDIHVTEKE
jgi:hypothetical protein